MCVTQDDVIIDPDECDNCGDCIDVCPKNVLVLTGKDVTVNDWCNDPRCIACQDACTKNAITLR